jgi:hypothetical protein
MSLLTYENAKTTKGESLGVLTAILYLAPSDLSGVDLCPKASAGCRAACLFTAGRGAFQNVKDARMRKTLQFLEDKQRFVETIAAEIDKAKRKAERLGLKLAVRLNGTSDIVWERHGLMSRHADVQFYDYTKIAARFRRELPKNYDLTFSRSESNDAECLDVLRRGGRVAVVFNTKRGGDLPQSWRGFPVIDGDDHDVRFLDRGGVVVGLRAKGKARHDNSGFVVNEERGGRGA